MAQNTALQEAIEDLKFMANKQTEPLQRIAFNMAITICEQHLPKELDGEQHLKQMINTYEKAGHKIGVPPDELDREAQYDWEKEFYRRMEINGYKRAEYIPEISDSVELFREFIQLGYFSTPPSNKR